MLPCNVALIHVCLVRIRQNSPSTSHTRNLQRTHAHTHTHTHTHGPPAHTRNPLDHDNAAFISLLIGSRANNSPLPRPRPLCTLVTPRPTRSQQNCKQALPKKKRKLRRNTSGQVLGAGHACVCVCVCVWITPGRNENRAKKQIIIS